MLLAAGEPPAGSHPEQQQQAGNSSLSQPTTLHQQALLAAEETARPQPPQAAAAAGQQKHVQNAMRTAHQLHRRGGPVNVRAYNKICLALKPLLKGKVKGPLKGYKEDVMLAPVLQV